jgi:putative transposase
VGWLVVSSVASRRAWIEPEAVMPMVRQGELAGVSRATAYAQRKPVLTSDVDLVLLRLIDEQYTRRPFYGSRKMVTYLKGQGHRGTANACSA